MNNNVLKGYLGFKGERGYSAYEIAVQNGFSGTEQDWLATLGTASHFAEDKVIYKATVGQSEFDLPNSYTKSSFLEVYVEGRRFTTEQYTLDTSNRKVILNLPIDVENTIIEVVSLTMSTNALPIVTNIDSTSTDETVPSTKAVYQKDFLTSNGHEVTLPVGLTSSTQFVVKSQLPVLLHPIGTVLGFSNDTDPNGEFGGTWANIGTQQIGVLTITYWNKVSNIS